MSPTESKTTTAPSVSEFNAGALRTTIGALQTPPDQTDFMMAQLRLPSHDDQVTTFPAGETAGLTSFLGDTLRLISGPVGFEMLPTRISAGTTPFTNAIVSPPSAVAMGQVVPPI